MAERGSFIVNPEGKIVCYEVNAGNIGRNAAELLRRVQASQFVAEHGDSVCPARWVPGSEVLHPGIDLGGQAVSLHRPRIIARAEPIGARSPAGRAFSRSASLRREQLADFGCQLLAREYHEP